MMSNFAKSQESLLNDRSHRAESGMNLLDASEGGLSQRTGAFA